MSINNFSHKRQFSVKVSLPCNLRKFAISFLSTRYQKSLPEFESIGQQFFLPKVHKNPTLPRESIQYLGQGVGYLGFQRSLRNGKLGLWFGETSSCFTHPIRGQYPDSGIFCDWSNFDR